MKIKLFNNLPQDSITIRKNVFVDEQGFENEFDSTDKISYHALLYFKSIPCATARFYTHGNNEYHIGRVAVIKEYRKQYLGRKIFVFCEDEIKKLGGKKIVVSSQVAAKGFYEKLGYKSCGEVYFDELCPHIKLLKKL